jgi:hypothetical protein
MFRETGRDERVAMRQKTPARSLFLENTAGHETGRDNLPLTGRLTIAPNAGANGPAS